MTKETKEAKKRKKTKKAKKREKGKVKLKQKNLKVPARYSKKKRLCQSKTKLLRT